MADRTWTVRVNLDELSAQLLYLDDDCERGAWLQGFQVGAAGAPSRDSWSETKRRGWEFGISCFQEAEAFREKRATAGRKSADVRREQKGSAQPTRTDSEHRSNVVQTLFEQTPELRLNQPTANSHKPTTRSKQPTPPTPPARGRRPAEFDPGMFDAMIPEALAASPEFVSEWHRWVAARKERKRPITPLAAKEQLKTLVEFGLADALASISQSIANDWQGLFAPKTGGPGRGKAPPMRVDADRSWASGSGLKPYTPKTGEEHGPAF